MPGNVFRLVECTDVILLALWYVLLEFSDGKKVLFLLLLLIHLLMEVKPPALLSATVDVLTKSLIVYSQFFSVHKNGVTHHER